MVLFAEHDLVTYRRFGNLTREIIDRLLMIGERQPPAISPFTLRLYLRTRSGELVTLGDLIVRVVREQRLTRAATTTGQTARGG